MALNIIDFSRGIRPEEIQENFDMLQEQLSRERLSVGGAGIASGLNITVNISEDQFFINVSAGSVIDQQGNEVFIDSKDIEIEPPILYQSRELITMNTDKTALLKHRPYSMNRRRPSEFLDSLEPDKSGVQIRYENSVNQDDYIRLRDIKDKTITITGALSNHLEVIYHYTAKRIDAVYLDENFEIKVISGTTDTTPTAPSIPVDAKFLIAYLEINNEFKDDQDTVDHAYIYIKDDLKRIRNLYTDSEGELYVCGVPFDDLQIIHLHEPSDPQVNTLWLNVADNTLYCWRATNEFTYKNKIDIDTDFVTEIDADIIFSTYMDFMVGENELSVYLNDVKLILGVDYEEIKIDSPTYAGNESDKTRGNTFRILQSLRRPDGLEDVLIPGDTIIYTITYKDSQYMWVPINKMNYISAKTTKVYSTYYDGINEKYLVDIDGEGNRVAYFDSYLANAFGNNKITGYPYKYQFFIFDREKDLNMHFTPDRKELSVMINQTFLHEDQFEEITVFDLYERKLPEEIINAAAQYYGWTTEYLKDYFNGEFDNSGIGFMLVEPLDSGINAETQGYDSIYGSNDLFVEAIVERRICSTPINRKLERSATFVYEDSFTLKDDFEKGYVVDLDRVKYRYNEHQLEVFVDGIKQIEGIDYIEEFGYFKENSAGISTDDIIIPPIDEDPDYQDQDYFIRKKSAICNKFAFLSNKTLSLGSTISIRITTNIYSYDHINNMLDNIGDILTDCKETVGQYSETIELMKEDLTNRVQRVEDKVQEIHNNNDIYLTTESIINISQLPAQVVANTIKSLDHINKSIFLEKDKFDYRLEDIWVEDYINIFYHNIANNYDNYWVRNIHYTIEQIGESYCTLRILNKDLSFDSGDVLYITGIKLSGIGREF